MSYLAYFFSIGKNSESTYGQEKINKNFSVCHSYLIKNMRPSNLYGRQAKKLDSSQNTTFSRELRKNPRYSTRDHWIQESIKWIFNHGLFWAVGATEKKKSNSHRYATFEVSFYVFLAKKKIWKKNKNVVASAPKSYIKLKVEKF